MNTETLNDIMSIKILRSPVSDFNPDSAIELWMGRRRNPNFMANDQTKTVNVMNEINAFAQPLLEVQIDNDEYEDNDNEIDITELNCAYNRVMMASC